MTASGAGIEEKSGYVPAGDGMMYCSVFLPAWWGQPATGGQGVVLGRRRRRPDCAARPARSAVVLLGPLAEEKKSSLRPLVEVARALAAEGFAALRVDFRGTGDASGRSEDVSLGSMIEDALSAVKFARAECGAKRVALLGLRLGGAVAVLAAAQRRDLQMLPRGGDNVVDPTRPDIAASGAGPDVTPVDALVLIEPVVSGKAYVRELSRQQAIRRMLTSGSARKAGPGKGAGPGEKAGADGEREEEGPFDMDGLALGRAFIGELDKLDVTRAALGRGQGLRSGATQAALVLQVGSREGPSRRLTVLAEALGERAHVEAVVARPFWLQTDYVDPAPATARVVAFLRSAFGGRGEDGEEVDSE